MKDDYSLKYIRDYYRVPANVGQKVKYRDRIGVIMKGQDAYIMVKLDGDKHPRPYHPTDGIEYLES